MNIVLITVDCLRADHLGCLGYRKDTSPFLDELARKGLLFTQAAAVANWTAPSFLALFTSTYPFSHSGRLGLHQGTPALAELLQEAGYRTAGFHSNPFLSPYYGFNRGFKVFSDLRRGRQRKRLFEMPRRVVKRAVGGNDRLHRMLAPVYDFAVGSNAHIGTQAAVGRARRWIKVTEAPFFLWLHLMDTHGPYLPASRLLSPRRAMYYSALNVKAQENRWPDQAKRDNRLLTKDERDQLVNVYDERLRCADRAIGAVYEELERQGKRSETLFIVTGDHGHAFMEHGFYGHIVGLYDELIHVPLLVLGPDPRPQRIDRPVSLIDLAPTVLDFANVRAPHSFRGRSLRALINDPTSNDSVSPVFSEDARRDRSITVPVVQLDPKNRSVSLRRKEWKYIYHQDGRDELYNVSVDPGETANLLEEEPELAAELQSEILAHLKTEREAARPEKSHIRNKIDILRGRHTM
jgi:arylsulfatase A-like enzyme